MTAKRTLFALAALLLLGASASAQIRIFHNIPYAHADRFEPAVMVDGWDRGADYSQRGPQCPQTKTIADMYLPGNQPWSEDCLNMSIYTPSTEGKLPVAVFLHGGSHHHGSSEWEVYDCSSLAAEQNIVTVAFSFRHGVFGYLYDSQRQDSNLGYEDQITALRWIRENIADFGGDPDNITLIGHSSGAQSVAFILANLEENLFRRAVVMSAPYLLSQSSKKAMKNAEGFANILGKDPREATAEELVEAEARFKKEVGGGFMPFSPSGLEQFSRNVRCGVEDVVVTYQKNDGSFYSMGVTGKELEDYGNFFDNILDRIITGLIFKNGANKLARTLARQGINTTEFVFTWCPPGANWKASHTAETNLIFGTAREVLGYGVLGDLTPEEYAKISADYRKTVADFARTGEWRNDYGRIIR